VHARSSYSRESINSASPWGSCSRCCGETIEESAHRYAQGNCHLEEAAGADAIGAVLDLLYLLEGDFHRRGES
jgi:hypothetical protein